VGYFEWANVVSYEPTLVCPPEDAPRVTGLLQGVATALAERERSSSPRARVSRVAATRSDGIDADMRAAAERARGSHARSLADSGRYFLAVDVTSKRRFDISTSVLLG